MRALHNLVEKHKFFRRLVLVWAMCLITWVTVVVFSDLKLVTAAVATALATIVGILATAIGFYQMSRHREEGKGGDNRDSKSSY